MRNLLIIYQSFANRGRNRGRIRERDRNVNYTGECTNENCAIMNAYNGVTGRKSCFLKFVIYEKRKARSLGRDVKRNQICRARLCGIASRLCHCLENSITSTTMKPLRRGKYMSGVFFYRREASFGASTSWAPPRRR